MSPGPVRMNVQSELMKSLAKLRKAGTRVGQLTDDEFVTVLRPKPITTGNLAIDAITSVGGLPMGRVVELYGPPSSGKTTCALQAMASAQHEGKRSLFIDHERSLDETYVRALGIDPDARDEEGIPYFIYMQPESFEDGANAFRELMPHIQIVTTDSVAAMVTKHELDSLTGKVDFATRAKLMHQYMRQVLARIADLGVTMVFLNHVQDVIDTSPMGQQMAARGIKRKTTPGGSALKFYASLRMEFKQIGNVRSEEYNAITNETTAIPTQTKTEVFVSKNKVGSPFGKAEVRIRFGSGFSNEWSALDVLVRHGRIKKDAGGVFRFVDPDIQPSSKDGAAWPDCISKAAWGVKNDVTWVRGEDNVIEVMEADPALRGAAITVARQVTAHGWDEKASAEEIAAAKAEESAEKDDLEAELVGGDGTGDMTPVAPAVLDELFESQGDSTHKVAL